MEPATDVDHIISRAKGGTDERSNLQPLCHACHSEKTNREDGGGWGGRKDGPFMATVTVVCGPPASGKTRYVQERARYADLIVDVDALYHAVSGLPWYDKPDALLPFVMEARDALVNRLRRQSDVLRAWVILGGAKRAERDQLRQRGAHIVVLETPLHECLRRISQDERRAERMVHWQPIIERWWREYEPSNEDTRLPD